MIAQIPGTRRLKRLLGASSGDRPRSWGFTLGDAYATGWKGVPCVFVLSTGRVGTLTLTALLELSPHVQATHEPRPKLLKASQRAYQEAQGQASYTDFWDTIIDATRAEFVSGAHRQGKIYAETNNRLTYLAPTLARFFPESKFILLHRHPIEVIRSGLRRKWYEGHPEDWARISPNSDDRYFDSWEGMNLIEKNAWYWNAVNQFSLDFLDGIPDNRGILLSSSQLFSGDADTMKDCFDFVGVEPPAESEIRKVLGKRMNANVRESALASQDFPQDTIASLRNMIGDTASRLGYSI